MLLFIIYLVLASPFPFSFKNFVVRKVTCCNMRDHDDIYIWACAMVMMIQSTSYFVHFHMQGSEQGPMFCRNVDLFPFRQISGSALAFPRTSFVRSNWVNIASAGHALASAHAPLASHCSPSSVSGVLGGPSPLAEL